jgi:protein-tyrosine-phosphatase
MPGGPKSILFVCSENALRSPMAEAIVKARYGDYCYVDSVGVRAGEVDPLAVAVMREIGLDISGHRAKLLEDLLDTSFDLVVTLSPEAHHQAMELTRTEAVDVVYWPTADPSVVEGSREVQLAAYRELRDSLGAMLDTLFRDS